MPWLTIVEGGAALALVVIAKMPRMMKPEVRHRRVRISRLMSRLADGEQRAVDDA